MKPTDEEAACRLVPVTDELYTARLVELLGENAHLRNIITGHEKGAALMAAGMESLCSLMDAMKQELRSAQAEVARLRADRKGGDL
jgi:hypothetical protein